MTVDDLRVAAWCPRTTADSTRILESTWTDEDGAPFDLDGHTLVLTVGEDEQDIEVDDNVATITLVTPDALTPLPLVLTLDGETIAVGTLTPSARGTDDGDLTLDVNVAPIQIAMTVIGGAAGGGSSVPSGPAAGVLSGTYPNPGFAVDMATQAELNTEATTRGNADTALDGRLDTLEAISIATDAELAAAVAAEAALARNADNLSSGTVNILRLPAAVATDTEVTNAVAAEVIARDAAISAAIAALVASAPGVLDTLDEIAAALGDDPNFATTIATALAGKQALDADLTAIAALTTTAYGRSVLELANAAAGRTLLGLIIGTDVQAFSSVLANTTASFTSAQETKLAGIATAATANDTDANLKARANHTGTQTLATISDAGTAAAANTGTGASNVPLVSQADARYAPITRTVGTGLGSTGTVNLDMASLHGTIQTITLTGNPTFTTSNRVAGRELTLVLAAGASTRTITWPSWIPLGAALPTTLAAGKTAVLSLTFVDTTDAAALAAYTAQP